jgi:hypothetical protein
MNRANYKKAIGDLKDAIEADDSARAFAIVSALEDHLDACYDLMDLVEGFCTSMGHPVNPPPKSGLLGRIFG